MCCGARMKEEGPLNRAFEGARLSFEGTVSKGTAVGTTCPGGPPDGCVAQAPGLCSCPYCCRGCR